MSIVNPSCLAIKSVSKSFTEGGQSIPVLTDITLSFETNKTYALTGVSGSGKSTLIYLLAGLEKPTTGDIYFNNYSISNLSSLQKQIFLNKSIGLVFQVPHLLKDLSVLENIMIKKIIAGLADKNSVAYARELLSLVGLSAKAHAHPLMLSGGEQQRVSIARALFMQPDFLLADEPTAHVDTKNRSLILDLLLTCQKQTGMGLIITSHDPAVSNLMDVQYRLIDKKIEQLG